MFSSAHGVIMPLSSADSASDPCTPKNHSSEVKITYAQPTTAPIEASGVEIVSMMIWWKFVPQWVSAQEIIPIIDRIIKAGITAENERETEAGTLDGSVITQLR